MKDRWRLSLALLFVAALLLRMGLAYAVEGMSCLRDECAYLRLARGIADGRGLGTHDGYLWPPGYPYFLAFFESWFGSLGLAPRLAQALISAGTLLTVYGIGSALYDRRSGLVAAGIFAFYPNLVAFTHYLWPETVFIGLFLLSIYALVSRPVVDTKRGILAGLLLGLAILFKAVAFHFSFVIAFWIAWYGGAGSRGETAAKPKVPARAREGRRFVIAGIFMVATLCPVLLGSMQGWAKFDRFFLVHTTTGRNLYMGTNLTAPSSWDAGMGRRRARVDHRGGRKLCRRRNAVERDRCEIRAAVDFTLSHPGLMLERVPTKLADLLTPTSFVVRHIRYGKYPHPFRDPSRTVLILVVVVSFMVIAVLGAIGAIVVPAGPGKKLVLTFFVYILLIHAITFGSSRFRLILEPLFLVTAAPMLTGRFRAIPQEHRTVAWVSSCAIVAALALAWWSRWPSVFGSLPH